MFSRWFISGPFWHHGTCFMKDGPQSFECSAGRAPWRMVLQCPTGRFCTESTSLFFYCPWYSLCRYRALFHTVCLLWVVTALVFIPFVSEDTILSSMVRITLLSSILFFSPSVSGRLQLPAQINKVSLESLGGISLNPRRERKPQKF